MTQQLYPPPAASGGGAFPVLAAALRARTASALTRWEAAVRPALRADDELALTRAREAVRRTLDVMAGLAGAGGSSAGPASGAGGPAAGGLDAAGGHPAGGSIREFLAGQRLLRRVVIEEVADQLGRPLSAGEAGDLDAAFDAASDEGVIAFGEHQARQLRAVTERHGKYLSFLSHDLRGGLNGIFLMTEVLRRELGGRPEFAETVSDLEMTRRSIMETVATMDRFVYAERFRKGKVQVNPVRLNLNALLGEVGAEFAGPAKEKGIDLKVEVPQRSELVSDRELLAMIAQNLVSNAVKFAGRGTAVRAVATPLPGGGWRVAVSDEGKGIEAGALDELLGALERGDTWARPGLGLSLAHQAARLLGAKLWAESETGRGSRFCVDVPDAGSGGAGPIPAPRGLTRRESAAKPEQH